MKKIVACCGFALALLGTLALEASAQTSCSAFYAICQQRCVASGKTPDCSICKEHLRSCKRTGCVTEGRKWGGNTLCNLKKS
ncbi:MAG TPA: hypothetical protein VH913_23000 [Hyphomicrobiaceae bacterium]